MTSPADTLQGARDIARRLHLADQIDRPHVDAQLQRRGGDDGRQPALLQRRLGLLPHFQGDTAVMCAGEVVLFVQEGGDSFNGPAIVGEDDGRTMVADLVAEKAVDRRPDRFLRQRSELLDGVDDQQIEVLAHAGVHDAHRPRHQVTVVRRRRPPR